jgi:16S rRNA (uracil1498-N3)-methyltransferase
MWEEIADSSLPLKRAIQSHKRHTTELAALIGPPGGFSHNEASAIQKAGADLVTLGPRVLRTETAAVTTMSTILYELGDLGG